MTIDYILDDKESFALVTSRGKLNIKDAISFLQSCLKDVLQQKARKVILDNRQLEGGALDYYDSYQLAACFEAEAELRTVKLALVVPPERQRSARDLETIVRNRGFSFLRFESVEAAKNWLTNAICPTDAKEPLINPEDCANYS